MNWFSAQNCGSSKTSLENNLINILININHSVQTHSSCSFNILLIVFKLELDEKRIYNWHFCELFFLATPVPDASTSQRTQTSLRRLQDVWKRSRRLTTKPDVFRTSGRWRRIYDVLKTSDLRHLEDVWFTTSWRRLIYDVLKTSDLRRLEHVGFTLPKGRPIFDILKTPDLRRLEDVCKVTSVEQSRSIVYTTSKEIIFSYLVLSEVFRKF